jgi:uncharacterized low-complexity protein
MKSNQKKLLKGSLIAGALITVAGVQVNATNLFEYDDLGSGSELRQELIAKATSYDTERTFEMKCGEGKCGETDKTDTKKAKTDQAESKTKEAKCGEGKCGEDKKESKADDSTKGAEKSDGKTNEAKCGEGKCGDE